MGHEILGERFISRTQPAWHGLGNLFEDDAEILASEGVKRVAGDVEVIQRPLFWQNPNTTGMHPIARQQAIVRLATKDAPDEVLAVTSDKWLPQNYVDLAESLDELSRTYKLETAGLLQKGGLCFLSLRGEDWEVGGEEMRTYFIANLSLTPGTAHHVFHSPVRVVCWNTNTMAKGHATINFAIPHTQDAKQRLGIAGNLVARFHELEQKTQEIFAAFQETTLPVDGAKAVIEAAYPDPQMPSQLRMLRETLNAEQADVFMRQMGERATVTLTEAQRRYDKGMERAKALRETAFGRYDQFEPADKRGTVWAAYQAVTEVSDWRQGKGAEEGSLWGSRANEKRRAFSQSMELALLN